MAQSPTAITAGSGTNIDSWTTANGYKRQAVVIGDPTTDAAVAPVSATKGLAVDLTATGANTTALKVDGTGGSFPVSGTITAVTAITNALPTGTNLIGHVILDSGTLTTLTTVTTVSTVTAVTNLATIGTSIVPGTSATHLGKAEDAAAVSGDTGVFVLGVRNETLTAPTNTDGDYEQISLDNMGRVMVANAPTAAMVRGLNSVAGTGSTAVTGTISGSASLKTYITDIQVANTGASTTLITFQDGSGGTALAYTIAPAGGGSNIHYEVPLVTTANTALYFACGTSSTTVYVSAQGYKAP